MKKFIAMLLVTISCLSVVACGASTTSGNSNEDVNIAGTYQNVTFLSSSSFTLNENSTYDRTVPNEKGTYEASKKGITLTDTNDDETIFAQKDNYFYRTNLICCFEEDEDYHQQSLAVCRSSLLLLWHFPCRSALLSVS